MSFFYVLNFSYYNDCNFLFKHGINIKWKEKLVLVEMSIVCVFHLNVLNDVAAWGFEF